MSLFTWVTDTKGLLPVLTRIADALDRIAPAPESEPVPLKPEDAVSYVDEQRMAEREQAEQMNELARWLREHPELDESKEQAEEPSVHQPPVE